MLENLMMLQQKRLNKVDLELMVSILWVIWHIRNKFIFESLKIYPNLSLAKAKAITKAFRKTKFSNVLNERNLHKKKSNIWTPVPHSWLKINVDATNDTRDSVLD